MILLIKLGHPHYPINAWFDRFFDRIKNQKYYGGIN
jgi:hypothetical protein